MILVGQELVANQLGHYPYSVSHGLPPPISPLPPLQVQASCTGKHERRRWEAGVTVGVDPAY